MIKLTKALSIGLCATVLMFSCSKDMEDVNPSSTLNGVSIDAVKSKGPVSTVDPLSFSSLSTTDGKTWSFTVQNVAAVELPNINSLLLTLTDCDDNAIMLTAANVISASVSGKNGAYNQTLIPSYKEGNGSKCDMSTVTGYVRFTDFSEHLTDGAVYTVSITLKDAVRVKSASIWAKTGNDCQTAVVNGPGCELNLCGEGQGYFHKADSWAGHTVTLGGEIYTEEEGVAFMNPNSGGGNKYVRFAFSQGATVILNRKLGYISETAYESELAAINAYFVDFGRLTTSNMNTEYDNSDLANAAKMAAGYIGVNIKCKAVITE